MCGVPFDQHVQYNNKQFFINLSFVQEIYYLISWRYGRLYRNQLVEVDKVTSGKVEIRVVEEGGGDMEV